MDMDRTNTKLLLDPEGVKVDEGERDLNSFPLTPGRASKYNKVKQQQQFQEGQNVTSRKDQLVGMSQDLKDPKVEAQLAKLAREKAEIKRLNDELREQRLQLEKEKKEIERMREEGSKSARGRVREDKDKLEGFEQHKDYMSHTMGESPRKTSKKTDLDAVRETENEDGNKRKKQKSITQSKRNALKSKASQNSFQSDMNPPHPGRCHGQSMATRESVFKLRTNKFGESRASSISNLHSHGRNQLKNRESSKKFEGSRERVDQPKSGAKVYYSDKSESSVEDLMDETPSNYNIPNGRLDGKSMGFRFGRNLNQKASSPDLIDNYESQKNLQNVSSEGKLSIGKKKKIKAFKKFRKDFESDEDNDAEQSNNNRSSIFNIDASLQEDYQIASNNHRFINNVSGFSNFNEENNNLRSKTGSKLGTLLHGNAALRNQAMRTNSSFNNKPLVQTKAFSKDKIKALEVAYLTKLVPNKSPPRGSTQVVSGTGSLSQLGNKFEYTEVKRASVPNRINNFTPDPSHKFQTSTMLKAPQINNFQ